MAPSKVSVRRGYLSESQLRLFLSRAHDELELLWWVLMCDGGLRVGEVRSLTFDQVGEKSIRVVGKGRKMRLVPVTVRVTRVRLAAMARYHFTGSDRICACAGRTVQRRFEMALKRAGIHKAKLCPHSLRHTFATRLLVAGVDIHRVGVLLGHASTATTIGYLHTNEDSLREATARLDELNHEKPPPGPVGEVTGGGTERGEPGGRPVAPSPGYDEIATLVGENRGAGGMATPPALPASRSPLNSLEGLL